VDGKVKRAPETRNGKSKLRGHKYNSQKKKPTEKYEALHRNETVKAKMLVAISGNGNRHEGLLEGRRKKQKLKKDVKLL